MLVIIDGKLMLVIIDGKLIVVCRFKRSAKETDANLRIVWV